MPVLTHLAVQVECQPPIQRRVVRLLSILALQQFCRPARTVLGYRQVGNTDVEQVRALELQVTKIQRAVARIVEDGDFDGMCACRENLFRGKIAPRIDGNLVSSHPNRVASRYAASLHFYRAAAERNLLTCQVILSVSGQ